MGQKRKFRYRPIPAVTRFMTKVTKQQKGFSITCAGPIIHASGENEL